MADFTRLYLVPFNNVQQIIDVPNTDLILSNGKYVPVQVAPTVTLMGAAITENFTPFNPSQSEQVITGQQTQDIRICWREPSDIQQYPDTDVIEATDPSNGSCICGITCSGTDLSFVKVYNVPATM
jgi:hypothetical protein